MNANRGKAIVSIFHRLPLDPGWPPSEVPVRLREEAERLERAAGLLASLLRGGWEVLVSGDEIMVSRQVVDQELADEELLEAGVEGQRVMWIEDGPRRATEWSVGSLCSRS